MNFSQLHEQLRIEMLRRIERGTLTTTMLARKIGVSVPSISNFLHGKHKLSFVNLDLILDRENLTVADLLPDRIQRPSAVGAHYDVIPLVSQAVAIHEVGIQSSSIVDMVRVQSGLLKNTKRRCSPARRSWERFVAVRLQDAQTASMQPILRARAIVLIDRHYNSLIEYSRGKRSIYAVRDGNLLRFRYVEQHSGIVLLRPHDLKTPLEVLQPPAGQTYRDMLIGRVFLVISEP